LEAKTFQQTVYQTFQGNKQIKKYPAIPGQQERIALWIWREKMQPVATFKLSPGGITKITEPEAYVLAPGSTH
jgi:hypothetical protein